MKREYVLLKTSKTHLKCFDNIGKPQKSSTTTTQDMGLAFSWAKFYLVTPLHGHVREQVAQAATKKSTAFAMKINLKLNR